MRRPRWKAIAALVPATALIIAGCAGGDEGDTGGGGGGDAEITVSGTAPENPLVPGNTSEAGGGKIVEVIYSGLVRYSSDNGEPYNEHAEKVDVSDDGKEITYTLKKGWTFHDGTEIKAKNYVDAWNYTAYSPNGQQHASFFAQIAGFEDVYAEDPDGEEGPKKAPTPPKKEMSGLEIIDDYTFKVKFTEPHAAFLNKPGYSAYMPLPDAFFKDPEAFEKKPIGSGPFKFVEQGPNSLTIERYEDYKGKKPNVKTVVFEFGTPEADYDKVRDNNLDFLNNMPPKALVDNVWQQDLEGRSGPSGNLSIQIIAFPLYAKKFQDVKFRQAISMAIDREQINKVIYGGSREPVDGYGVPNLPLWEDGACGDLCKHNPEEAKKLFDESGYTGAIEITSNADGGHKEWIEAACGQIESALDAQCKFVPVQEFGVLREQVNAKKVDQIYRSGWGADYPHVENFLNPLYRTGGSSNDGGYSNKTVDAKLAEADAATDEEEAAALYHEAEEMIAQDMPYVPLWSNPYIAGWSDRLDNVKVGKLSGELDLIEVQVK